MQTPPRVTDALRRAEQAGFTASCEPPTGALLAVLAAAVPPGGRILEIGTGAGTGLAWLVAGLGGRTDVTVQSVECDRGVHALTTGADWPPYVDLHLGDAVELIGRLGRFDLIFADAPGGKWHGLDRTIAALAPGAHLLVDDMAPPTWGSQEHQDHTLRVREVLVSHPDLTTAELDCGPGLILCTRRR